LTFDIKYSGRDNFGIIQGCSVLHDGWYLITLCSKGMSLIPSVGMVEDEYDVDRVRKLKIIGVDIV
jgi:hypothetical protein